MGLIDWFKSKYYNHLLTSAQNALSAGNYRCALTHSAKIFGIHPEAKAIYAEASYQAYSKKDHEAIEEIVTESLYAALGEAGDQFLTALARYVPHASHADKYISEASRLLLIKSASKNEALVLSFLKNVWSVLATESYFKEIITPSNKEFSKQIASSILSEYTLFLSTDARVNSFIEAIESLADDAFLLLTLETFLSLSKNVKNKYVAAIIKTATKQNGFKIVKVLNRGLEKVNDNSLLNEKSQSIRALIANRGCDLNQLNIEAQSLVGIHRDAEFLLANISLKFAESSPDKATKESFLLSALDYKKKHNRLFNDEEYAKLLPTIESQITSLAKQWQNDGDSLRSKKLFYCLRDNGLSWYNEYAELGLRHAISLADEEQRIKFIENLICEKPDGDFPVEPKLYNEFVRSSINSIKNIAVFSKINRLKKILKDISHYTGSNKPELVKLIQEELDEALLVYGKELERAQKCIEAINAYGEVSKKSKQYTEAQVRSCICRLKSGAIKSPQDTSIENLLLTDSIKPYHKDLCYRYCLYLLSYCNDAKAEEINTRILSDDSIKSLCLDFRLKRQEQILEKLNSSIEKLNNKTLTAKEAITLGQELGKAISNIHELVSIPIAVSEKIKVAIRCYAIEKFYQEGNYIACQQGLKVQDSEYLKDPIALRNLAVFCLLVAEAGQLDNSNYKEILAIWATAIYQQRIFVNSLDYTSWDDPYTFTLDEAFGQLDKNHELPDNVNYDSADGSTIIAIKDVQKALIARMDAALNANPTYQQFFNSQIEAMDKLVKLDMDENSVIVAPYLMSLSPSYKRSITNAIKSEVDSHYGNWEDAILVGVVYGLKSGIFADYINAKKAIDTIVKFLNSRRGGNTQFTDGNIAVIKKFPHIYSELISVISSALNKDISQDLDYKNVIKVFGPMCSKLKEDSLAFAFSNYVNQSIVHELNEKKLKLHEGAKMLSEIYDYCRVNPHLKRNIGNIVEALIHNYITDGVGGNLSVLETILNQTRDFDQNVVNALNGGNDAPKELLVVLFASNETNFNNLKNRIGSKSSCIKSQFNATGAKIIAAKVNIELSGIIDAVNNNTMPKCDALTKVYNIYKSNKDNQRVCQNLATLIPMCIMEYVIADKSGKAKVTTVLDSLTYNMSMTFRSNNSEIRQAHSMIWNQLPAGARMALTGAGVASLTPEGQNLKRGLDYLKKFS